MKKCLLLLLIAACFTTVNTKAGRHDPLFGNNGIQGFPGVFKILTAPDQSYYTIGGYSGSPIVITKYLSGGAVDQSYGTGGSATVGIHPFDALLLSDGKILLAGTTPEYADGHPDRMVVRLNTDGFLDPSFKTIIESASPLSFNEIQSWTVSNNRIGIIGYSASLASQISGYTCTIYDTSGAFVTYISLGPPISPISNYKNSYSISFQGDKILVSSHTYIPNRYPSPYYEDTIKIYNADGSPYLPGIVFSCPKDTVVATGRGLCSAIVNGLDPIINSSGNNSAISYMLSGATTGNGTGTVSGISFNKGITTVQYAQADNPANSCSFTVTVEDREAPEISNLSVSPAIIWPPDQKMWTVDVNYISQDNCGIANNILTVASNELKERGGNPGLENDWSILNSHQVQLRATQGKNPKERVYTISVTSTDEAGNQTTRSINIDVANEKINSGEPFTNNKPFVAERPGLGLQVNVLSNPSTGSFTILTNSNYNEKITMRVINMLGIVIDSKTSLPAKGQLQIGNEYPTGFYIAVFTQGSQKCLVKLLKQQ